MPHGDPTLQKREKKGDKQVLGAGAGFLSPDKTDTRKVEKRGTGSTIKIDEERGDVIAIKLAPERRRELINNRTARLEELGRVAVRGEVNIGVGPKTGRITAEGANFFPGLSPSLQPVGFNLGIERFLGIEEENLRRADFAHRSIQGSANIEAREAFRSGQTVLQPLLNRPDLRRQKLTIGGTTRRAPTIPIRVP